MGQSAEGEPDRSAAIYAAVISALIAGGQTNFDPAGRPVSIGARSYAGNLGRKSCTFIVDGAGSRWQVTGTTGIYSVS
jgi:hypothetical protein